MSKTSFIRARTDIYTKNQAENIFREIGLTTTQAITLFYKHVVLNHGLPFKVKMPNKKTLKVMRDTDAGKNLVSLKNIDNLFKKARK